MFDFDKVKAIKNVAILVLISVSAMRLKKQFIRRS